MKRFLKWCNRHRFLAATAGIITLYIGWYLTAYPRGMLAAHFDLARGEYRVLTYGYRGSSRADYRKLLRERYGVSSDAVAGCIVDPETEWYAAGYNSVSEPRILERFGKDIFSECAEEAWAAHEQKRLQEKR